MPSTAPRARKSGERRVLSGVGEIRAAVVRATAGADRSIAILTPNLEPDLYDHEDFLEALKRFILARSFARVKVLITRPSSTLKSGNDLVGMGRRLNSYIEFRNLRPELGERRDAFFITDEAAIIYRIRGDQWEAIWDPCEPAIARYYLKSFDELWHACAPEPELRHSQL
jgi:hypothetical protein